MTRANTGPARGWRAAGRSLAQVWTFVRVDQAVHSLLFTEIWVFWLHTIHHHGLPSGAAYSGRNPKPRANGSHEHTPVSRTDSVPAGVGADQSGAVPQPQAAAGSGS